VRREEFDEHGDRGALGGGFGFFNVKGETMKRIHLFVVALCACGTAQAAGIGIRAGTTGIGADVAWGIAPALSARVGYSALNWGYDVNTSNASYKGDLKLSNLSGLLDFHPLGPVFRITAAPGNSFSATVEPAHRAAPYLGIGWGDVSGAGVNFYADLGVMFMGSPKATLNADCTGLTSAECSTLQSQVAAEQTSLEDELKHFKTYPVLNVGVTIGF
jgi:hypothetical protein